MKIKGIMLIVFLMLCGILWGCEAKQKNEKDKVSLVVWSSEGEQVLLKKMADEFCEKYKEDAEIEIQVGVENEDEFKYNYLKNVEKSADVFSFPNDQLYELISHESLLPITLDAEHIIEGNGGENSRAVQSAMYDGKLYACPKTASNGYFMFYNKKYFSKKDTESFDRMLEVAAQYGKKVSMDWSSGWYIYSFFGGAGFELKLNPDGATNSCNWNETAGKYKGTDVAEAMLRIASNEAFYNTNDKGFQKGVKDGEIIAGVSGTWDVDCVSKAYGTDYAATKLPTYTLCGEQVQMSSFSGYKLVGVNATTKEPEWSQRLAEWITNEENQRRRFVEMGEGPSNTRAAQSDSVKNSPAIVALSRQSKYSIVQNVGKNYWGPSTTLGTVLASGNKDQMDLQKTLDEFVTEVEAPAE